MMTKQINSFEELINLLENSNFTSAQLSEIIKHTLQVYIIDEEHTDLINEIKEYWAKYGNLTIKSRPLFLNQKSLDFNINDIYRETIQK